MGARSDIVCPPTNRYSMGGFAIDTNVPGQFVHVFDVSIRPDSIKRRFDALRREWERDTMLVSNAATVLSHPAFMKVIALGDSVVPAILEFIESHPKESLFWTIALQTIVDDDPVPVEERSNPSKRRARWIEWGRRHGRTRPDRKYSGELAEIEVRSAVREA